MPPTLAILAKIITLAFIIFGSCAKVLQITQKNLPNVLKFLPEILILYHHPDCKYSINYKQKFTHHYQSTHTDTHNVGMIDCSQQNNLCVLHNISSYPSLKRIYNNSASELLEPHLFLADITSQYQQTDEFLASQIYSKLSSSPHFVLVLFEEEGMPVSSQNKLKDHIYSDRVFYLSEGRVAKTFAGFVKNKPGCWIFQLRSEQSGQLYRYSCGSTYQTHFQLEYQLQKHLNETGEGKPHKPTEIELTDQSNYQNQSILGYKQFLYWLKHYYLQLQISTHTKVSMCSYIYLWSQTCEHCNYEQDMRVIQKQIDQSYENGRYKYPQDVNMKYKIYSYDVSNNRLIVNSQDLTKIAGLNSTQVNAPPDSDPVLIPNLLSICFSTPNNRNLAQTIFMNINMMNKIIASENLRKFISEVIQVQFRHASSRQNVEKEDIKETDL